MKDHECGNFRSMRAHLFLNPDGSWRFSGYNACGDPHDGIGFRARETAEPRRFDAIVELPGEFRITEDGLLYPTSPQPAQFMTFTALDAVLMAHEKRYGFRLVGIEQKEFW